MHRKPVPLLMRVLQTISFSLTGICVSLLVFGSATEYAPEKDMKTGIIGAIAGWIIGRIVWEALSVEDEMES